MKKVFYAKTPSLDEYYKVAGDVTISNKGHMIFRDWESAPISKYQYYKQPKESRFIIRLADRDYFHAIGNNKLFQYLAK